MVGTTVYFLRKRRALGGVAARLGLSPCWVSRCLCVNSPAPPDGTPSGPHRKM